MTPRAPITPIYGIVPAAGLGRRMGRPKQTLPFGESTMVGTVARTLLDAGLDAVVVVTRSELLADLRLPIDHRLSVAVSDDDSSQMIDSIRIGLSALLDGHADPGGTGGVTPSPVDLAADGAGILVVPGDMPGLSVTTCQLCVRAFREEPTRIIVATHLGRRGHPLVFPITLRANVVQLDKGLNTLAARYPDRVRLVETRDSGAVADVDTWDQYHSL